MITLRLIYTTVMEKSASEAQRPRPTSAATVAQLDQFDEIIDVRSESEFAEDHIPGAVNYPVLNDAERIVIGTLYKQVSAFDAKKAGAALVSANIARHLSTSLSDRPRGWKPLVYCWRGGGRSAALTHVFSQIGWRAGQLGGGYKAYRRVVIDALQSLPASLDWRVVCGMTGTGKSRLLRALQDQGAQVLDLEALAAHRGSVLGHLPGETQPPQKLFESRVWQALRRYDPSRPIFVESESKKIGKLRVPEALIAAMWASACIVVEAPVAVRVALLKDEYAHFLGDVPLLNAQLDCLRALHGSNVTDHWQHLAHDGAWDALTEDLLVRHYDPAYTRAIHSHYPRLPQAQRFMLEDDSATTMAQLATQVIAEVY